MNPQLENRLRESVRHGAATLDHASPDWFREENIDLDTLNLESCELCVIGQLRTADHLDRTPELHDLLKRFPAILGFDDEFNRREPEYGAGFGVLQSEWERQIKRRRYAGAA